MVIDLIIKALGWFWIALTILAYVTFIGAVIGMSYGAVTGEMIQDLWNQMPVQHSGSATDL